MQGYRTVRKGARVEDVIQKSRFIGWCFPAGTEEAALALLNDIRKRHRDATHHAYAYSVGGVGGAARFSDDGEPGGTAGLPIMEILRRRELTDLVCVVTRYFGGVLLGTGGLTRAYGKSAATAIEAAEPVWMRPCARYEVVCDYSQWRILEPLLHKAGNVDSVDYTEAVRVMVTVPAESGEAFEASLCDRTDGRICPTQKEVCFGEFPIL